MREKSVAVLVLVLFVYACGGGSPGNDGGLPDGGECLAPEVNCGGTCADLMSDHEHCGECFHACGTDHVCGAGKCSSVCPDGLSACSGSCVDLESSAQHCGSCDHLCRQPGAAGECVQGACASWACLPGRVDTDGDVSNGCEGSCSGRQISTSGALDYDLDVVRITGKVTVDGHDPGPVVNGVVRGTLSFLLAGSKKRISLDLGSNGPATYQTSLFAGNYAIELANTTDCPDGPFPCGSTILRKGVSLLSDGNLDLDVSSSVISSFEVSGQVTVNGAVMSPGGGGGERGRIVFRPETGAVAEAGLGTGGPATYQVELTPGSYEVSVTNDTDCLDGAIPCQRKVLRTGLVLNGPGVLDLDLKVIDVSGALTVNGAEMQPGAGGGERGQISFSDGTGSVSAGFGRSGPAAYLLKLYSGNYTVAVSNSTDCPASGLSPVPCQTRRLASGLVLESSGVLDYDLSVVAVSGAVTINGAEMSESVTGGERGRLVFSDADGELEAGLGQSDPATYQRSIFKGVYRVTFENDSDCPQDRPGVTPCQSEVLTETLSLTAAGVADYDLSVIQASGQLTVNGAVMPSSGNGQNRGMLVFSRTQNASDVQFQMGANGPATYQVVLFPGHYEVRADNLACRDDQALPCQRELLRTVDLAGDGVLDLDLDVVSVSGSVTVNGSQMDASPNGRVRGLVVLTDGEGVSVGAPVGVAGPAQYLMKVFAGTYRVDFTNDDDCPLGVVPCLGMTLRDSVQLSGNGALDLELSVLSISGQITMGAAQMPDSVAGGERGRLFFVSEESGDSLQAPVESQGPAVYQLDLYPGSYGVVFEGTDCPVAADGATPCQDILLEGCGW
ncbi:MAG TPA: hypothetical protein VM425_01990 [Myxococcota bacterium]|nr:hypothetical protein [Myxococcota bacterium]